jgi:prepilin-type N-terminal cleavage/methylation domain-containing protein
MLRIISNLKNKRGFTLIELIVVLAVLAIILAIAIPRFVTIQDESRIKADVATAEQIIKAARLMEAKRNDGNYTDEDNWDDDIMAWPTPESGGETPAGEFALAYNPEGAPDLYVVTWEVEKGSFLDGRTITVTEGEAGYTDVETTP